MTKVNQSAAKPLNSLEQEESSQTIPKGSTFVNKTSGSGSPSACNDGGDDIVENKFINSFINKSNLKYSNKFDYSLVKYVNAKTKVVIKCPEHGNFEQTPDKHLQSKFGCPLCCSKYKEKPKTRNSKSKEITKEKFIENANNKYNNKYNYIIDNWNGIVKSEIIVECPKHGQFTTNARSHILQNNKYGCPQCSNIKRSETKTKSYEDIILEFNKQYNNFYTYCKSNKDTYINKRSKIKIICPKHGEFIKSAQKHSSGQGCFECKIEELVDKGFLPGGYCDELFKSNPEYKDVKAYLYYFKINNGKYFKIGISRNDPMKRAFSLISKARLFGEELKFELILSKETTLFEAYKLEQNILNNENRIYKKWSTELFNIDIYESIKNIFI